MSMAHAIHRLIGARIKNGLSTTVSLICPGTKKLNTVGLQKKHLFRFVSRSHVWHAAEFRCARCGDRRILTVKNKHGDRLNISRSRRGNDAWRNVA